MDRFERTGTLLHNTRVKMKAVCLILLGLVVLLQGLPTAQKTERTAADLALMWNDIRTPPGADLEAGIVGDQYRWPNRILPYVVDPAFTPDERNVIYQGMRMIQSRTCIQFFERSWEQDWVFIQRGARNSGCSSAVGKQAGQQILNLEPLRDDGSTCVHAGTVAHELIHAIGWYHEQSRYDRDDWVQINWSNIPQNKWHNFEAYSQRKVNTFGVQYDTASIMHYEGFAFAIDTNVPTIISKQQRGSKLGGEVLTDLDAQKINKMYKC